MRPDTFLKVESRFILYTHTYKHEWVTNNYIYMHKCMLSCFSCVQLFAALWTVACQAPLPLDSPSKNIGVGCHARLFPPRDWTHISYVSCIGRWVLYHYIAVSQFSRSVVSDSLPPHESQHARPPYPSPTPGVYSNSGPSSWWFHPAISSSVVPFSSCPQSLPASGSFPMSQLFTWGGQSIGVLASASVLPMNTQDWSPLGWTGWISWQSKGLSRVFSNTTVQKHQFFGARPSSQSNFHIHTWLLEKP